MKKLKSLLFLLTFNFFLRADSNIDYKNQIIDLDCLISHEPVTEILDKLSQSKVQFILLVFTDILGNLKEILLPVNVAKKIFINGFYINSANILGCGVNDKEILLKPDITTLRILPWTDEINQTALLICNIYKNDSEIHLLDTRNILQSAVYELRNKFNLKLNLDIEFEFYILKLDDEKKLQPTDQNRFIDIETSLIRQQENHILMHTLKSLDINLGSLNHEIAPGKYKLVLQSDDVVNMADQITLLKYALKIIGQQLNYKITFMPKPLTKLCGNGLGISYIISNVQELEDQSQENNNFNLVNYFVSGNLDFLTDLIAITCPTINSYKRIITEITNPIIKIRPIEDSTLRKNLQIRTTIADCLCNPYLALSAIIKTGIAGIKLEKKLKNTLNKISKPLPHNLETALENLNKISVDVFSNYFISKYIEIKRKEILDYNIYITDWEIQKYL